MRSLGCARPGTDIRFRQESSLEADLLRYRGQVHWQQLEAAGIVPRMVRLGKVSDAQRFAAADPFGGDREAEAREQRLWVDVADSGEIRGYASTSRCTFHTNPYLEFLFVFPDFRRKGVASCLLNAVEAQFPGRRVFTSTEEPNDAMLTLLERRGYTRAGAVQGLNDDHGGAAEVFFYRDI